MQGRPERRPVLQMTGSIIGHLWRSERDNTMPNRHPMMPAITTIRPKMVAML